MKIPFRKSAVSALALVAVLHAVSASAAVTFIGQGNIPGTATDQSGLTGLLEDGVTPRNLAGGFGSAIAYTGHHDLYIGTPDRGPADGATSYIDRFYDQDQAHEEQRKQLHRDAHDRTHPPNASGQAVLHRFGRGLRCH